jgi:PHP family Zn ribbon phosphoesterase
MIKSSAIRSKWEFIFRNFKNTIQLYISTNQDQISSIKYKTFYFKGFLCLRKICFHYLFYYR